MPGMLLYIMITQHHSTCIPQKIREVNTFNISSGKKQKRPGRCIGHSKKLTVSPQKLPPYPLKLAVYPVKLVEEEIDNLEKEGAELYRQIKKNLDKIIVT
jgi:hypothetical protein